MKKLMIAAAVAAMGFGAFAECGEPKDDAPDCATVYKFAASVKTTVAKTAKVKAECSDPTTLCYRVTGSQKVEGVAYNCECACTDDLADFTWVIWCKKTAVVAMADVETLQLNRIDKTTKKVEAAFTLFADYMCEVTAAGFGTFDTKNDRISKISGNFAGVAQAPFCTAKCAQDTAAYGFGMCDGIEGEISGQTFDDQTIAYGTWSLTYNKSLSKKYAVAGKLSTIMPAWVIKAIEIEE